MEYDNLAAFSTWTKILNRLLDNPDAPEDLLWLAVERVVFWSGRLIPEVEQLQARAERLVLQ